jgi:hypothetical protein
VKYNGSSLKGWFQPARIAVGARQSKRLARALELGADELMNRADYSLRDNPRALARVKWAYRKFCSLASRAIERTAKVPR